MHREERKVRDEKRDEKRNMRKEKDEKEEKRGRKTGATEDERKKGRNKEREKKASSTHTYKIDKKFKKIDLLNLNNSVKYKNSEHLQSDSCQ